MEVKILIKFPITGFLTIYVKVILDEFDNPHKCSVQVLTKVQR